MGRLSSMDKITWLTLLCKRNTGKTPTRPFSAYDTNFVLYATDRISIVRVPCSEKQAAEYKSTDPYLEGFFSTMKKIYEGTHFKGKMDALLLKEMAGEPEWGENQTIGYIKLDGGYFSKTVIARALAGWDEPEAILARSSVKGAVSTNKDMEPIPLDDPKKPQVWPLLLHSRKALVVIAASFQGEPPDAFEEFPASAVIYNP